jgi:hypothetical protein
MKVKLTFESELSWYTEKIIEVQDNISESDVEAMFPIVLGVKYNKHDCSYESIDGHIYSRDEILAYTD